jgi:hypothetical protein
LLAVSSGFGAHRCGNNLALLKGMDHSERRDVSAREALLEKVRTELRHLPGLALTAEQASRLFGIPDPVCSRLLTELVEQGAMTIRGDGRFAARDA